MELKGIKILRNFKINAMVIYPVVLFADKSPSAVLRKHEEIHLQQVRRDGFMRFYGRYLAEYLRGRRRGLNHDEAYRAISYEREAYANQSDPDFQVNKSVFP